jgi:hypothetical protein
LRVTLCSTRFGIRRVGASGYQNLNEVQCPVMNTGNVLSMFFETLTLAIVLVCMCGTLCRSWLWHCTSRRKVPIVIPDGVIEIFH